MDKEDAERILRWVERYTGDIATLFPALLTWEMVSRIQQYNSKQPKPSIVASGEMTVFPTVLALPSPIMVIEQLNNLAPTLGTIDWVPGSTGTGGGGGGGGPPPGTSNVTFSITRNGTTFLGTGYVTVDGVNHVTTGTGAYTTSYTIGSTIMISFTGLGITCTPTTAIQYTVLNQAAQTVDINIPC